jgi:hypothetical protein
MKKILLGLGIVGIFAGVIMMIIGISSREIRDVQLSLIVYGFLIALVSSVIMFITRIVISQRG